MRTWYSRLCLVPILGIAACTARGADKTFDQHFTAPTGGHFVLETDVGAVTVVGHDSRDLTVHADISGPGADDIKVTAEQTSSGVTVLGRRSGDWFHFGFSGTRVRFTIELPRDYPVELKTSGGGIDVRGVSAEVRGATSGGPIALQDIAGPIDMHTSGGGIGAENLKGSVKLRSSGGPIDISKVTGDLNVYTSGGGIELTDIDGRINADTSGGGVRVEALSNHGIMLSTSGGSIRLMIPADTRGNLDAETSGGRVRTQIALSTTELSETNRLRGQINGGGNSISLHTSGGGIEIGSMAPASR
jgi:DUF4097 and DUF4098 domain-containing protein YvlB